MLTFWVTFVIFKKLPEAINRQMGENWPNPVTLNGSSLTFRNVPTF
jgi:hypothetical protein